MHSSALFFLLSCLLALPAAARTPACAPVDDAAPRQVGRDICINAHVYDVVTLRNGVRFLDLCTPEVGDEQCHFSIVNYREDGSSVGDLEQFRDKDIQVRGILEQFGSRYLLVLNDARQFHGGAAHFRPDPRLLSSFSAENSQPTDAPELRVNFHHKGRKLERE